MAYKFNNLMVKVLPEGATLGGGIVAQPTPTANPCYVFGHSVILNPPRHQCPYHWPSVILNPPTPTVLCGPYAASHLHVGCPLDTGNVCGPVAPSVQQPLTYTPVIDQQAGPTEVEQLTALKDQLAALQAHVSQRLDAATAASLPQTRAEAEHLEKQLQSALDEVRTHKQTLAK